eukprot:6197238-Pleurochrysis_carterae.AAC.2
MPGYVRVCYANLPLEKTREAAERLKRGLAAIADARDGGMARTMLHGHPMQLLVTFALDKSVLPVPIYDTCQVAS